MLKVTVSSTGAFQIFNFTIDGFNGTIRKSAVIDFSKSMFFNHDKGIDDVIFICFKQITKISKNFEYFTLGAPELSFA